MTHNVGHECGIVVHVTGSDNQLRDAILTQLQAEIAAAGLSMRQLAMKIGRPYDSTRNYLRGERAMPVLILVEIASALNIDLAEIITRARRRIDS